MGMLQYPIMVIWGLLAARIEYTAGNVCEKLSEFRKRLMVFSCPLTFAVT
jgi:hypothetical protein